MAELGKILERARSWTPMTQFQTILQFDMRAPAFGAPTAELYAAALDMAAFADKIGVDRIGLMEHHGSEDGYLSAPFVMGGAVAARTSRLRINLGAVVLPLHDPVKVAEQIAVLDQLSAGRLDVVLGAGYVPAEFAMFRVSLHDRARLLDEGIDIILRALQGERFEAGGRISHTRRTLRPRLFSRDGEVVSVLPGGMSPARQRAATLLWPRGAAQYSSCRRRGCRLG
jgi:alkanesulfonate monooxygenase SsuD/methylene tetrahydromethanopterin reductase-like flavin-dependent oxidoreductase (luciferase family)